MKVLTDCVKTIMPCLMFSYEKPWPFGLSRDNWVSYFFAALIVLAALNSIDAAATSLVSSLPEWLRAPFYVITRAGKSDWIFIPSILITILGVAALKLGVWKSMKEGIAKATWWAFFVIAGVGVPGLTALLFKRLIGRARPVHLAELGPLYFQPVLNDWSFQSFPSGDSTTIFALAAVLMFLIPKLRFWFFIGAILVGLSRIMVGMHFPSDVFGGMLTGMLGAYAVRNYFATKGWLFVSNGAGGYRLA